MSEQIAALATTTSEGRILISELVKTDGFLAPDGSYSMDFSATLTFAHPKCMIWRFGGQSGHGKEGFAMLGFSAAENRSDYYGCPADGMRSRDVDVDGVLPVGAGYSATFDGRAIVLKKESGWQLEKAWLYVPRRVAPTPTVQSNSDADARILDQVGIAVNFGAVGKAAVEDSLLRRGVAPSDAVAAGMNLLDADGGYGHDWYPFIESGKIQAGEVVVTFSGDAHESLRGRRLFFTPYGTSSGGVYWSCGEATAPAGLRPIGGTVRGTDVPEKYLPSTCK